MPKKYYIATAIPYANGAPHMGHPMQPLYGDVLARHYREKGYDVFFLVGLDENGQSVYNKAKCAGVDVRDFTEDVRKKFMELHKKLNDTYDGFIRTTDEKNHWPTAQEIWRRAEVNGDIYKKNYKGLYCVGCEEFKLERDLVDGKCPDHLTKPEEIEEENYFFALSKYQDFLLGLFKNNKDFVYPQNKYNEAHQIIKGGLEDVSISRPKTRLPWGVPVPGDDSHVMYVWFDALTNYLSGIGFTSDKKKFNKYWPADIQIMGKDNNKWHSILWPAMLESAGLEIPNLTFVHSYVLGKGNIKMSKTIVNVVNPIEMIDKYGTDAFRYFILAKIPIETDGAFDEDHFREVYNSELAGGLGNLLQRTLTMVDKYGVKIDLKNNTVNKDVSEDIEKLRFNEALASVWGIIRSCDQAIDKEKPWELAKTDKTKLTVVLNDIYSKLAIIAEAIAPFMPETSEKMKKQLKTLKPEPLFPRIEKD